MWYTGNGDSGDTTMFGCSRRFFKSDEHCRALGALDELNAYLGVVKTDAKGKWLSMIENVQHDLFIAQAEVGGADMRIKQRHLARLEDEIAAIERALPPLETFVLSGGTRVAAGLEYARTLARAAERDIAALHRISPRRPELCAYINRLSSYLFALARAHNHEAGITETPPHYGDG